MSTTSEEFDTAVQIIASTLEFVKSKPEKHSRYYVGRSAHSPSLDEPKLKAIICYMVERTFNNVKGQNSNVENKHIMTKASLAKKYAGEKIIEHKQEHDIYSYSKVNCGPYGRKKIFTTKSNSWSQDFEKLTAAVEDLWGSRQHSRGQYFDKQTNKIIDDYSYFSENYISFKLISSLRAGINQVRSDHSKDTEPKSDSLLICELVAHVVKSFKSTMWVITSDPGSSFSIPIVPQSVINFQYRNHVSASLVPSEPYGMIEIAGKEKDGILPGFLLFLNGLEDKHHSRDKYGNMTAVNSPFLGTSDESGEVVAFHLNADLSYEIMHLKFTGDEGSLSSKPENYYASGTLDEEKWEELMEHYKGMLLRVYKIWLQPKI